MKLASIERIHNLTPIEGADRIECAHVLGWQCVVKKGEFSVGDLCVFHFPDTIVDPENPVYAFLKDKRIRTCKFKKQVSQGLALPLSAFNCFSSDSPSFCWATDAVEGVDVSAVIKIQKYEKQLHVSLAGVARGNFPTFLRKTDEDNLRSNPRAIDEFRGKDCYITQKYDGSSATFYYNQGVFGVCSRNLDLTETEGNPFWEIARRYNLEEALKKIGNIAVQAELYGEGIQGNKLGIKGTEIAAYNLFDITAQKYCDFNTLAAFCELARVPIVKVVGYGIFTFTLEELIQMANSEVYPNGSPCEGIVVRPRVETRSEVLRGRLSGKVISETFALKYGE